MVVVIFESKVMVMEKIKEKKRKIVGVGMYIWGKLYFDSEILMYLDDDIQSSRSRYIMPTTKMSSLGIVSIRRGQDQYRIAIPLRDTVVLCKILEFMTSERKSKQRKHS